MSNRNAVLAIFLLSTHFSIESPRLAETPLEAFLKMAEVHNLNISLVTSDLKYRQSTTRINEAISVSWSLTNNKVRWNFRTVAALERDIQKQYLDSWENTARKTGFGAKTQIIKVCDGKGTVLNSSVVNPSYVINSPGHVFLTKFPNGASDASLGDYTGAVWYNFVVEKPSDDVKTVQVISSKVHVKELSVSDLFPEIELIEIKRVLPKLYLVIDNDEILATLLTDHLEREFDKFFQVVIGFRSFAVGTKPFANLEIGDTKILVFSL
ncbi:hypothetical protein HUJ04_000363 [Dendroctonus ponderosae]|uniref:Uncharacterized protein n=1 Tax=Dendroctonus ponderosae TaxID=77166 RepID=A0AAR5PDZ3_DENPD|nr:hypothetical protein HUJ04_000363 [Dendroctonus ponderosae]KAH1000458.1 hypothetical protein HUJ04_000363 [Dendroctonus ponderosae]